MGGVWCQALSLSRPPVPGGRKPGPIARVFRVRVVWAWGPSTGPSACALASRCCVLWQRREGVPRGGAPRPCEGRVGSGARLPPATRPRGGQSGSTAHVLWARMCGHGGPALSLWRACPAGGPAPRGWWEVVPGGVISHRCEARLVSGAFPLPAARPWGRAARPRCPCFSGAGGVVVGTQHRPHSVHFCEPALRPVGVAGGCSRGGCLMPL